MRKVAAVWVVGFALLAFAVSGQGPGDARDVVRVLDDRELWGDDFYGLLAALADFQQAGEARIAVFADRAVGARRYESSAAAERGAVVLKQGLRAAEDPVAVLVLRRYKARPLPGLEPQGIRFLDDRSFRLAASAPSAQFLATQLTIATVQARLGKPEKVTTELLDDGTERRPIVLTIYWYAGGAIAFAESDVAARPGRVNRVFLDLAAVASALRKEVPK